MEKQRLLAEACVAVVGCGGLGCPVLQYLCAAGVGKIILIDGDVVNESNLQRQILFEESDCGKNKALTAALKLKKMNSSLATDVQTVYINSGNALALLEKADVIADCTDNIAAKYLLNDAGVKLGKPLVQAAIFQYEGQLSVFNHKQDINYRDVFPLPPPANTITNCAEGGVMGSMAGVIGCLQAGEILKVITGIGETLEGQLLHFDFLTLAWRKVHLKQNADNPIRKSGRSSITLIDYEPFCSNSIKQKEKMKTITATDLQNMMNNQEEFVLIDVREPSEFEERNIGGLLIPVAKVPERVSEIPRDKKVVVHCKSGVRSARVIEWLEHEHGYDNLYNLQGGIMSMPL